MATRHQTIASLDFGGDENPPKRKGNRTLRRANALDGDTWLKYSLSVWSDIRKSPEEIALKHPATFPIALARRLIRCFTTAKDEIVLDPFCGSGSTLLGAMLEGKQGIGLEIVPDYVRLAETRISKLHLPFDGESHRTPLVYQKDARQLLANVKAESIDFCMTSPPYWDILSQKRTADYKTIRDYGGEKNDLAKIHGYWEFIAELGKVFGQVFHALRPGKYCIINIMDLRKKDKFFPFHSDLARQLQTFGFIFDDLFIWDRKQEYNNLRPLGYPSVFRVNKVHEYLLVFQKPNPTGMKR